MAFFAYCLSTYLGTVVSFIGMESVGQARLGTSRRAHLWHACLGVVGMGSVGWHKLGSRSFWYPRVLWNQFVFVYSRSQGLVILGIGQEHVRFLPP